MALDSLDDLDDLLNEVEGILQAPSSRPGVAPFSTPVHKPRAEPERRREFDAFSAPSKLGARGGVAATPLGARGTPARFGGAYAADSLDAEVDYDFDSKTTPRRAPGAVGAGPGAAATPRGRPAYPAASAFGAGAPPAARRQARWLVDEEIARDARMLPVTDIARDQWAGASGRGALSANRVVTQPEYRVNPSGSSHLRLSLDLYD